MKVMFNWFALGAADFAWAASLADQHVCCRAQTANSTRIKHEIFQSPTDAEWRPGIDTGTYRVLRQADTERPFTRQVLETPREPGVLPLRGCGEIIFTSDTKFDSAAAGRVLL